MTFIGISRDTKIPRDCIGLYACVGRGVLASRNSDSRRRCRRIPSGVAEWRLGEKVTSHGLALVLANGGLILVQSADRLVGSS